MHQIRRDLDLVFNVDRGRLCEQHEHQPLDRTSKLRDREPDKVQNVLKNRKYIDIAALLGFP